MKCESLCTINIELFVQIECEASKLTCKLKLPGLTMKVTIWWYQVNDKLIGLKCFLVKPFLILLITV